jgi:hypothetical protein
MYKECVKENEVQCFIEDICVNYIDIERQTSQWNCQLPHAEIRKGNDLNRCRTFGEAQVFIFYNNSVCYIHDVMFTPIIV